MSAIIKTTGLVSWIALSAATSAMGRKAIFSGMLYMAGGTIVSTIGLVPVMVAGAIIWLL